jgi:AraC family transcriptional regulator, mar-sox-rob regulon activator
VKDLYSWIDNNIESDLSVDEIVARSGYSRRHLYNLFVQQTGKSVAEYIRLKKLRYAATLLKLTHMSIVDISIRFGFDSSQSFSRLFKKNLSINSIGL